MKMSEYMQLAELWKACSSCAGMCCALGKRFFEEGIEEVDTTICPILKEKAPVATSNRVLQANSTLFWFAQQVCVCVSRIWYIKFANHMHMHDTVVCRSWDRYDRRTC